MGRHKYGWTEQKIQKRIQMGHGQGFGETYIPWIKVHDVPSRGRVHRVRGNKTGRVHHFLSDGEYRFFIQSEWHQEVRDIREQFPLDRSLTFPIASSLGIRHPRTMDGTPNVMTTDFLLVLGENESRRLLARTFKYKIELGKPRVLEKLEIERRCWKSHGVDWAIATEEDLDLTLISNVEIVRPFYDLTGLAEPYPGCLKKLAADFLDGFSQTPWPSLGQYCASLDSKNGLPQGNAMVVAKHLLAHQVLNTDMTLADSIMHRPLAAFSLVAGAPDLQRWVA